MPIAPLEVRGPKDEIKVGGLKDPVVVSNMLGLMSCTFFCLTF